MSSIQTLKRIIVKSAASGLAALVLSFSFSPLAFAADYNCGAYGAGAYDEGGVCGASTGNGLVDTGQKVLAFGIPAAMIIAGTVILFKVRKKKPGEPQDPTQ